MTTMIERVARAICAADKTAPDPDAPILIGMRPAKAWEGRVDLARAAIEAMKEPTKGMIDAAYDAHDAYEAAPANKAWCGLWSAWRAMIDAALKEGSDNADLP